MNFQRLISTALPLVVAAVFGLGSTGCTCCRSIEGSYVLDYRELPDGKQVHSPDVIGMMSFSKDHRNFNVYWQQDGKPASISAISKYTLSKTEFTEENIYYLANGVDGKGPTYDTSSASGNSPVSMDNGKMQFKLPLHDEPKVTFDKDGFTATRLGAFVDHWTRVK